MKYTEVMTKQADVMGTLNGLLDKGKGALSNIAPGELGWGAVGAGGGAMLGYTLARLLHRKPSAKTKLLYALLGAAAGGIGSHYALKNMSSTSGDGSKLDEIRNSASSNAPEPIPPEDRPGKGGIIPWKARYSALGAGTLGLFRGAKTNTAAVGGKEGLLTPDLYQRIRRKFGIDRTHLENMMRSDPNYQLDSDKKSWLNAVNNKFWGYDASQDARGRITLTEPKTDALRTTTNAVAGAAAHALAAAALHGGINWATKHISQDIDATNAAATRDQLIRNLGR